MALNFKERFLGFTAKFHFLHKYHCICTTTPPILVKDQLNFRPIHYRKHTIQVTTSTKSTRINLKYNSLLVYSLLTVQINAIFADPSEGRPKVRITDRR